MAFLSYNAASRQTNGEYECRHLRRLCRCSCSPNNSARLLLLHGGVEIFRETSQQHDNGYPQSTGSILRFKSSWQDSQSIFQRHWLPRRDFTADIPLCNPNGVVRVDRCFASLGGERVASSSCCANYTVVCLHRQVFHENFKGAKKARVYLPQSCVVTNFWNTWWLGHHPKPWTTTRVCRAAV